MSISCNARWLCGWQEGDPRRAQESGGDKEVTEDLFLEKFRNDVAKFSGNYDEFFIAVKRKDGNISWKSSDTTWAIGACRRYQVMMDEMDRQDERKRQ